MRICLIVLLALSLTGCATVDKTFQVLDVFFPDPPECNAESFGDVNDDGELCTRHRDRKGYVYYSWEARK
jgi:hypothetical protein